MPSAAISPKATLTVDVYADNPQDLRRRLRNQAQEVMVSLLPGGMVVQESEETLSYQLSAGAWAPVADGDGLSFASPEGHTVSLRGGRLTVTLAK